MRSTMGGIERYPGYLRKLFNTSNMAIIQICQQYFAAELLNVLSGLKKVCRQQQHFCNIRAYVR